MPTIRHFWFNGLGFVVLLFGLVPQIYADGFIIPTPRPGEAIPPLAVKYHRVTVEIRDQVAKTSVDEVFINNFDRDIEGTFMFPLPEGASISQFAIYVRDEKIEGDILDSEQARKLYEDIVRRLKDPALLEYIGRNTFRARVFPIPARGEKRIQRDTLHLVFGDREGKDVYCSRGACSAGSSRRAKNNRSGRGEIGPGQPAIQSTRTGP